MLLGQNTVSWPGLLSKILYILTLAHLGQVLKGSYKLLLWVSLGWLSVSFSLACFGFLHKLSFLKTMLSVRVCKITHTIRIVWVKVHLTITSYLNTERRMVVILGVLCCIQTSCLQLEAFLECCMCEKELWQFLWAYFNIKELISFSFRSPVICLEFVLWHRLLFY